MIQTLNLSLLILITIFVGALIGCGEQEGEATRVEFVEQYVQSIYENSDFYRKYTYGVDLDLIEEGRSQITPQFRIVRREYVGPGDYEYVVEFENGRTGLVTVFERGDTVKRASLVVNPVRAKDSSYPG